METILQQVKKSQEGDKAAREEAILGNLGLVHHIAKRYLGRGYEEEELFQVGVVGLMKAVDHFDLSLQVKFSTYAVPLIMGEIRRFLRDDAALKVSRSIKENAYRMHQARESYLQRSGREPSVEDLQEITGLTKEELLQAQEAGYEVESLHQPAYQKDGTQMELIDRIASGRLEQEQAIDRIFLGQLFDRLEGDDRQLLWLRYYEGCTQTQVAGRMGISQVQVSRREKKLLLWMRGKAVK